MNHVVDTHEAETQLSSPVAPPQRREDAAICALGDPVAEPGPAKPRRVFGLLKDKLPQLPLSAFAPMSDEEAAEWGL